MGDLIEMLKLLGEYLAFIIWSSENWDSTASTWELVSVQVGGREGELPIMRH